MISWLKYFQVPLLLGNSAFVIGDYVLIFILIKKPHSIGVLLINISFLDVFHIFVKRLCFLFKF